MGQCSLWCGGSDMPTYELANMEGSDFDRPEFDLINILEFERRVKCFAHPANNGKVSVGQL